VPLGIASFSFALYVFPDALPLWRRTPRPVPAPLEPGANLFEIVRTCFRQASSYVLGLDIEDLQRLFYLALALFAVSVAMFYLGRRLRRES
jgi:hypothetical protein